MIVSISTIDIWTVIKDIDAISNLATVFNQIPSEEETPPTPYIFFSKPSDVPQSVSNKGFLEKRARISVHITGNSTWHNQSIVENIMNTITNTLVVEDCLKITDFNGITVTDITEWTPSPLFINSKKRTYLVKDYLFTYKALDV